MIRFHFSYFVILIFSIAFISCKKKITTSEVSVDLLGQYISNRMPTSIQPKDAIRIRFANAINDYDSYPQEVEKTSFKLTPHIKGTAVWEDPYTFRFLPDPYFDPTETYQLWLDKKNLLGDEAKSIDQLAFEFTILPNRLSVDIETPRPKSDKSNEYFVVGNIQSNIPINDENAEKLLNVNYPSTKPVIKWKHQINGLSHSFIINNLERKNNEQSVTISWDGKLAKSKEKGNRKFTIPAIGDFKVVSIDVEQIGDKKVTIHFSDILAKKNFNGLVQINKSDKNFRHEIEDNKLIVYPNSTISGSFTLLINKGIQNYSNTSLSKNVSFNLSFEDIIPQVRLAGQGVIIPSDEEVIFPFEYVNIKGVTVEIFQIFENNVMQFLQYTDLNQEWGMEPVGRIVKQEKITFDWQDDQRNVWQRIGLDLSKITDLHPGSIYQIRLGFEKENAVISCDTDIQINRPANSTGELQTILQYNYDYPGFEYTQVEDPCYPAFYSAQRFVSRNVLASNFGIVAKGNEDNSLSILINNLINAEPMADVEVKVFDFQQQLISQSKTNKAGRCDITSDRIPFFVIVRKGTEVGYLKLNNSTARPLSDFDVSGTRASAGFKGFIYAEREVWRPGDTIFIDFILGGDAHNAKDMHPVNCTLYDARGNKVFSTTQSIPVGPIYSFPVPTNTQDPTGNWRAVIEAGPATFTKYLKVETIMPNRLKIKYAEDESILAYQTKNQLSLQSNWLHGAPAKNLKAKVEMQILSANKPFNGYSAYTFYDPSRKAESRLMTIFEGNLSSDGNAKINLPKAQSQNFPGKMRATIKTRVFEEGGAFSSDHYSTEYLPFETYVGISIPENRWGSKRLELEKENEVRTVAVDSEGKPLSNRKLIVGVYESSWRWWWDRSDRSIAQFSSSQHTGAFMKDTITTNSIGEATLNITPESYGSYLVRVCDLEGNHCSGDFYYAGRAYGGDDGRNAAAKLSFKTDKNEYNVGETIKLSIPSSSGSTIQISIENNEGIVRNERIKSTGESTNYSFEATNEMLPNVYAHVDMIQPHNYGENDLPIRMYGVLPIMVIDKSTILQPELQMPNELKPEERFSITVSEKNDQPMAYTIAVVDEGLLDLTRAKTPDPHNYFFAKEALGLTTWDMYEYVLNNYGGQMDKVMSIGGGGEVGQVDGVQEANRFKPVVMHLGPFYLKKGEKAKHDLQMPNYVGAVRTMVIAADNKKYGAIDKSTQVKKPLMVLATMPRKFSPGESVSVPVNVFAMDKKIKNVTVRIKASGAISVEGASERGLVFNEIGDQLAYFKVTAGDALGIGRIEIEALSSGEEASQTIELNILNPNPFVSNVIDSEISAGETKSFNNQIKGMNGSKEAILEVYGVYPFSIEKRLKYLIRYPYGCLEQTTSSAFPQLFVQDLIELNDQQKNRIAHNINGAINSLKRFLSTGGGFSYWPGDGHINDWSNSYAGHFLLEAKEAGYFVDEQLLRSWKSYQINASNSFDLSAIKKEDHYWGALNQAYRLYTLAKSGSPEFGAMNRLKSNINISSTGKALLASAYALAGQNNVATEMLNNFDSTVPEYAQTGWTYGSSIRDRALIVEAFVAMDQKEKAAPILRRISEQLDRDQWMSTQSTAFSLIALSKYYEGNIENGIHFGYSKTGDNQQIIEEEKPIFQIDLQPDDNGRYNFQLQNMGKQSLFVRIVERGQPTDPITEDSKSHIAMNVRYTDMAGKLINYNSISQGTDFIAEVTIKNSGTLRQNIDEMALQQIFPSGWEIINQRLTNFEDVLKNSSFDYQDIRDDRVYTFFDIYGNNSVTYKVALNAAYVGRFMLPAAQCEAMYDHSISATKGGGWVEVVKSEAMVGN